MLHLVDVSTPIFTSPKINVVGTHNGVPFILSLYGRCHGSFIPRETSSAGNFKESDFPHAVNHLTPNDHYMGRTAQLTSRR